MKSGIDGLSARIATSDKSLDSARQNKRDLTNSSEAPTAMTARMGRETIDTPYIDATRDIAQQISARFELGIQNGEVSLADLFDRDY